MSPISTAIFKKILPTSGLESLKAPALKEAHKSEYLPTPARIAFSGVVKLMYNYSDPTCARSHSRRGR